MTTLVPRVTVEGMNELPDERPKSDWPAWAKVLVLVGIVAGLLWLVAGPLSNIGVQEPDPDEIQRVIEDMG